MRKDFFGGLWSVNDWEWLWGRTAAQIELRCIDQPIIVYQKDKDKEKPWKDGVASSDYAQKAYKKWLEGKKARERDGKTLDLSKGLGHIRRLDFDAYLKDGKKIELE